MTLNKKRKRPAAASKRKVATPLHLFNDADDPPPRQRETRPPDPHAKYATASQVRLRYGGRSEMWLYRILKVRSRLSPLHQDRPLQVLRHRPA